jgi:uncharacterized protein
MALIGRFNRLPILHEARPGLYLDGGEHGEILLPGRFIPPNARPGELLDVFIYRDSEDRLIATRDTPHAAVGEFAYLRVVETHPTAGAFLDWGLDKDLLLPMREQSRPVRRGSWVVVYVTLDEKTQRVIASARVDRFLDRTPAEYRVGEKVKLLVYGETDLGYNAIIENKHRGLLYRGEMAGSLVMGQKLDGYVRAVRPDGKIDLGLDRAGYARVAPLTDKIVEELKRNGGRLPYHDESSPEEIREALGMSKKAFKQAIGSLYKAGRIKIEEYGIRLLEK